MIQFVLWLMNLVIAVWWVILCYSVWLSTKHLLCVGIWNVQILFYHPYQRNNTTGAILFNIFFLGNGCYFKLYLPQCLYDLLLSCSVAHFLESRGMLEEALDIATDPNYRFDLAVQLGSLEVAKAWCNYTVSLKCFGHIGQKFLFALKCNLIISSCFAGNCCWGAKWIKVEAAGGACDVHWKGIHVNPFIFAVHSMCIFWMTYIFSSVT